MIRAALLLASLLFGAQAHAAPLVPLPPQPAGVAWPTHEWSAGKLPDGVDQAGLAKLLDSAMSEGGPTGGSRAIVLVQGGRIVAERYGAVSDGFGPDTRLISWSMAKSITQALVGIAARKGLLDPDRPMGNPRWSSADARQQIPWRQWLQMVDGQDYFEIGALNPASNDAAQMLFGPGRLDAAAFAASLPLIHKPGEHWNYNSAGMILLDDGLSRAISTAADPQARRDAMLSFMRKELFEPLGMTSAQPEFDATGTFLGSALVYATARDFARFGLLYLRDGAWDGNRILPEGWVDFARSAAPGSDSNLYGAGFWITPAGPPRPDYSSAMLTVPDAFEAQGFEGQLIIIVPSKDLVFVHLGHIPIWRWRELAEWSAAVVSQFPARFYVTK